MTGFVGFWFLEKTITSFKSLYKYPIDSPEFRAQSLTKDIGTSNASADPVACCGEASKFKPLVENYYVVSI